MNGWLEVFQYFHRLGLEDSLILNLYLKDGSREGGKSAEEETHYIYMKLQKRHSYMLDRALFKVPG